MKIIRFIAIDPGSISSWQEFRYVMEKLGFSNGLVLKKFPKSWPKQLLSNLQVREIERQKIVSKLQQYKNSRMVNSGVAYRPNESWLENIRESIQHIQVDKLVLREEEKINNSDIDQSAILDADEDFFRVSREGQFLNTPENIIEIAEPLVSHSTMCVLVDPYFKIYPGSSHLQVLAGLASIARNSPNFEVLRVYIRHDAIPKGGKDEVERVLHEALAAVSRPGFCVEIFYVDDTGSGVPLHARYLLTEKGGIRYDKGFRPGEPPVLVDVSLLDSELQADLLNRFDPLVNDLEKKLICYWVSAAEG